MSTAARKARKRNGIPFVRERKIPTPPEERSFVTQPVPGADGTKYAASSQPRSRKSVQKFLSKFTPQD